jgi:hypothetical protein
MSMDKKTIILAVLAVVVVMNIAAFALMGTTRKWPVRGSVAYRKRCCFW